MFACVLSHFSHVWFFSALSMVACQAPLSMGLSRQEYWSGWPCHPPGHLPEPCIESVSLTLSLCCCSVTQLYLTLPLYLPINMFLAVRKQYTDSFIQLFFFFLFLVSLDFSCFPTDFKRVRGWKKLCRGDSHSLFLLCFSQISVHVYVRCYCGSHVIYRILKGIISIVVAFSL